MNKYLRITDIDDVSRAFRDDDLTSPDTNLSMADNYRLREGDVMFARTGASVGKTFIYRESDGLVYFAGFLIRARIKPEYSAEFVFQNTLSLQYEKYIKTTSQRSGQPGVNAQEYGEYSFLVPGYLEQKKIGNFLHQIDNLITLHQRQHIYKNTKSPNYTISWEQRKLSEVVGVYDGVHQTPHYTDSGVMFLSVENIATLTSQKFISEEAFERDYKVYPQNGDVLMTRIGDVGTPNVVETTEKLAFYVSLALLKPMGIDSYFLCNAIQSPRFKKGLKDRTLVTAIPQKINKDEIGKVDLLMPKSTTEQAQIGAYFRQLDNLITLHQREQQITDDQAVISA